MIEIQPGEEVIAVYRRHWLVIAALIIQIAVAMALVVAAPFVLEFFFSKSLLGYGGFIALGTALLLELLWLILFFGIADYYLDYWIITNERLIFIELHGIFSRTVASVSLRNIQDISTEVNGVLPTLLKFGNVKIQSAGTEGEFVFKQIAHPYDVKDIILATREDFFKRKGSNGAS